MKYEHFLEKVQQRSDEFLEIGDILSRHKTLVDENRKLDYLNQSQEQKLEEMKQRVNKYTKEKGQEILQLNNDISNKKTELEKINDEMKDLKDEAEEVSAKKLGKVSEFAQILMAINNIEEKCDKMQSLKLRHKIVVTDNSSQKPDYNNL